MRFLGIEGGGSRTVALLADHQGKLLRRIETGPANLRLISDADLLALFQRLAAQLPAPNSITVGLAGARTKADRQRVASALDECWSGIPAYVTHDLETGLEAGKMQETFAAQETPASMFAAEILLLSGTGSCCFGKNAQGESVKIGGWGHLLGDRGSGYEISMLALRALVRQFDRRGGWPFLGQSILAALELDDPEELIGWVQNAGKREIAALAPLVFEAEKKKDPDAASIVRRSAEDLAEDALECAGRLASSRAKIRFLCAGGILFNQPSFLLRIRRIIRQRRREASVLLLPVETAWGAVVLAKKTARSQPVPPPKPKEPSTPPSSLAMLALSPTEQRNAKSRHLDRLPATDAIQLMLREEQRVPAAILREKSKLAKAIGWISARLKKGGRLIYVGAGTSGRLGVLDASECPPTFRSPPAQVLGIIAGGTRALSQSIEGAEDDPLAGEHALRAQQVAADDVIVGIAASGRTPFVWKALEYARQRHAKTILITFNPHWKKLAPGWVDLAIVPVIGPEVLTGSTRLKAGTATKLILNILSTLSMVQMGKVISNLMVDLNPSNAKLRDRAERIVQEITGRPREEARRALEKASWNVKRACRLLGWRRFFRHEK